MEERAAIFFEIDDRVQTTRAFSTTELEIAPGTTGTVIETFRAWRDVYEVTFDEEVVTSTSTAPILLTASFLAPAMPTTLPLERFMAMLVAHLMHDLGWSETVATRWVAHYLDEGRSAYQALDAPLGDTDEGLLVWLQSSQPPSTTE